MSTTSLPRPDVYLAALGRSGSTMLANLLTTPPDRWMIIEPRFANGSTGRDVLAQAREVGISVTNDAWEQGPTESTFERNARVFDRPLRELSKWGLKEVRSDLLLETQSVLDPVKTVVLVRDLRDAAASLFRKTEFDSDASYDSEWLHAYLANSPAAIMQLLDQLPPKSHRVVRYEDIVSLPDSRRELANWLEWPLDGDPGRNLSTLFQRRREVELHQGVVSRRSLDRRRTTDDPREVELVEWVHATQNEFQSRFGYAD